MTKRRNLPRGSPQSVQSNPNDAAVQAGGPQENGRTNLTRQVGAGVYDGTLNAKNAATGAGAIAGTVAARGAWASWQMEQCSASCFTGSDRLCRQPWEQAVCSSCPSAARCRAGAAIVPRMKTPAATMVSLFRMMGKIIHAGARFKTIRGAAHLRGLGAGIGAASGTASRSCCAFAAASVSANWTRNAFSCSRCAAGGSRALFFS